MSTNYRDICDFNEEVLAERNNPGDDDDAPSLPPLRNFPGTPSQAPSGIEGSELGLTSISEQAEINSRISPRIELSNIRGDRLAFGNRLVNIYPQQHVYNFPFRSDDGRVFEVGLRGYNLPTNDNKQIRFAPSQNRADYESDESVINVVTLQDSLRYCYGGVHVADDVAIPGGVTPFEAQSRYLQLEDPFPSIDKFRASYS